MASAALRLSIAGRVQGVGYRAWAAEEAQRRQLRGWVRNRRDGGVEMLIVGAAVELAAMVEACWRGPALAEVSAVESEAVADDGSAGFAQRPTA
jgi:acylphosphatase